MPTLIKHNPGRGAPVFCLFKILIPTYPLSAHSGVITDFLSEDPMSESFPRLSTVLRDLERRLLSGANHKSSCRVYSGLDSCLQAGPEDPPTPLIELNLPVGSLRALLKDLSLPQDSDYLLELWNYIWFHSRFLDVMSLPLYAYQYRVLTEKESSVIRHWQDRVSNWRHSDELAKIYAVQVEEHPEEWYPLLVHWNTSFNPWKRRQSLIAMMEYARLRKRYLSFSSMINLVDALIEDQEYYVQKAAGWTLRELTVAYPEEAKDYLKENTIRLSAVAFSTSIEKIHDPLRKELKEQRKWFRKSGANK